MSRAYRMGPRAIARRLELLAAQIRSGRRFATAYEFRRNTTHVPGVGEGHPGHYEHDGTETITLTVTEMGTVGQFLARMRSARRR